MVATPSEMVKLGVKAPHFNLPDTKTGKMVSLDDFKNKALIVGFVCNHCPYVIHIHDRFVQIGNDSVKKGAAFVLISANDAVNYPDDAPDKMKEKALKYQYSFPYLYDESQETAKAYQAVCTPDWFVFDTSHSLIYRGQFDGSRPSSNVPVTGNDLSRVIEYAMAGKAIDFPQISSIGCSIKWKS